MKIHLLLLLAAGVAFDAVAADNDISGTVGAPKGAESGVWVIAETTELPTRIRW